MPAAIVRSSERSITTAASLESVRMPPGTDPVEPPAPSRSHPASTKVPPVNELSAARIAVPGPDVRRAAVPEIAAVTTRVASDPEDRATVPPARASAEPTVAVTPASAATSRARREPDGAAREGVPVGRKLHAVGGATVPETVTVPAVPAKTTSPAAASVPVAVPATVVANVALVADHVPDPPTPGVAALESQYLPVIAGPTARESEKASMPNAWALLLPPLPT